jgi:8-oxo-dGTP pyrophosphatase MutT (NUDIX family)
VTAQRRPDGAARPSFDRSDPGRRGDVPGWLQSLAFATRDLAAHQLTGYHPPAGASARAASILILFGDGDDGPEVLLLERSHDLRSHAGQVAFPGGVQDPGDADAVATALREAQEETGLDPAGVTVVAALPVMWLPTSNFDVTPVIGWWHARSGVGPVDPAETASVHVVALADLLDPAHRVTIRHPSGHLGPAFLVEKLVVWGFTALVMSRLFEVAGWEVPWDDTVVVDLPDSLATSSRRDLSRADHRR